MTRRTEQKRIRDLQTEKVFQLRENLSVSNAGENQDGSMDSEVGVRSGSARFAAELRTAGKDGGSTEPFRFLMRYSETIPENVDRMAREVTDWLNGPGVRDVINARVDARLADLGIDLTDDDGIKP